MGVVTFSYVYLNSLEVEFSLSFSPISTEREQISCPPLAHNVISKTRDSSRQEEGGRVDFVVFLRSEEASRRCFLFSPFFCKGHV